MRLMSKSSSLRKTCDSLNRALELGRVLFEEGDIDLIELNIYETSVADAALFLLEARFNYHFAQAVYTAALSNNQLR